MAGEEAVLIALQAVHNPASPLPQRQAAQALLDGLRADLPSAFRCGVALVRPEVEDAARHFGLSLFEHLVKSSWANFSREQQEHMKNIVLELIAKVSVLRMHINCAHMLTTGSEGPHAREDIHQGKDRRPRSAARKARLAAAVAGHDLYAHSTSELRRAFSCAATVSSR